MPRRTCPWCSTAYADSAAACPKCAYPADGRFDAPRPAPPRRATPTDTCAHCGAAFPAGRPACPHCGSDDRTGWRSDDDLDEAAATIPEFDEEDYERVVREAHPGAVRLWTTRQVRILVIGLLLVAAMIVPAIVAFLRSR